MKSLFAVVMFVMSSSICIAEESLPSPGVGEAKQKIEEAQLDKAKSQENQPAVRVIEIKPVASQGNADCKTDEEKTNPNQPGDYTLLLSVLTAIFTGALVITGVLQYCVYKAQAKIMESRERPWIIVIPDNPESGYPVGGTQPFPFHFRWLAKNVGSSPAFLTELYVTAGIGNLPIPNQELPYRENPEAFAKFILPPDGVHESRVRMNLSPEEIEGYVSGQKCIMFYGLIKYDDARGDPHRTHFCCYWEKQSGANRFNPVGPPKTVDYT